jgi:hypothetical protein
MLVLMNGCKGKNKKYISKVLIVQGQHAGKAKTSYFLCLRYIEFWQPGFKRLECPTDTIQHHYRYYNVPFLLNN